MNERERQNKFAQNSNIKNSEFDRQNTNATRYVNPINVGKNLLPIDEKKRKKIRITELLIDITSTLIGILFFIFIVPLCKYFFSKSFYNSLAFLLVALLISVSFVIVLKYIGKKIISNKIVK